MGRKFVPFEVIVHFTKSKNKAEIEKITDDFYLKTIESVLTESTLSTDQKYEVLDHIAEYHKSL